MRKRKRTAKLLVHKAFQLWRLYFDLHDMQIHIRSVYSYGHRSKIDVATRSLRWKNSMSLFFAAIDWIDPFISGKTASTHHTPLMSQIFVIVLFKIGTNLFCFCDSSVLVQVVVAQGENCGSPPSRWHTQLCSERKRKRPMDAEQTKRPAPTIDQNMSAHCDYLLVARAKETELGGISSPSCSTNNDRRTKSFFMPLVDSFRLVTHTIFPWWVFNVGI